MAQMKKSLNRNGEYVKSQHESIDFQKMRASNESYTLKNLSNHNY